MEKVKLGKTGIEIPEIDVVRAWINHSGFCMDAAKLGIYDQLGSVSWLKKFANELLPRSLIAAILAFGFSC